MIYIGIDDTDTLETRGTGRLARRISEVLSSDYTVHGIVRHQLSKDPRVPCTRKNGSVCIVLDHDDDTVPQGLFEAVKYMMLSDFYPGSDPGLCMTCNVPPEVTTFGHKAKEELVTQKEARDLARAFAIRLEGLGGTNDGIIGALASVGLSAGGNDGRYIQYRSIRDINGPVQVSDILKAGIHEVRTLDDEPLTSGIILAEKLRPSRRNSLPVVYVHMDQQNWQSVKLD